MKHWHKLDRRGKTKNMTLNPFRAIWWILSGWEVRLCRLPFAWFDRKRNKWRGDRFNPNGQCCNGN